MQRGANGDELKHLLVFDENLVASLLDASLDYSFSFFFKFRTFGWAIEAQLPAKSADLSASVLPLGPSCAAAWPSTSAPHYYDDLIPFASAGSVFCRFARCITAMRVGRDGQAFIHLSLH